MGKKRDQELAAELSQVQRRLELLSSSVQDMQEEYAREVRTQQVTVVDEEGVHRVVLSARHETGSVLVRVNSPDGQTTGAELYAWADPDGGEPGVGVCVLREGEVTGTWPA